MKNKISLLFILVFTSYYSFSQTKEEVKAVDLINTFLKSVTIDPLSLTLFNSDLTIDKDKLKLNTVIQGFHPSEKNALTLEIKHNIVFDKNDIKDYFIEIEETENGLYNIYTKVNLKHSMPLNYYSKMYLNDTIDEEVIEVSKVELSNNTPIEKDKMNDYKKAIELLFNS